MAWRLPFFACLHEGFGGLRRIFRLLFLSAVNGGTMNRKGFTLIELLIVVVIIGILAAIAIPKFSNTKEKALVSGMKSDLRNYASAQESYYSDYTTYGTLAQLQAAPYNFKLSGANTSPGNGASGTT